MVRFKGFRDAFPAAVDYCADDFGELAEDIPSVLGVAPPSELIEFWAAFKSGYYGEMELYFFGGKDGIRPNLVAWNQLPCWQEILPAPEAGGPIFFADTCFGEQLGFRWEKGACLPILCTLDSMDSFVLADGFQELFEHVLTERFAITDPDRYTAVRTRLGVLPPGQHYAPIQSPMIGGEGTAENFEIQDAVVHVTTCVSIYKAIKDLPKGTKVDAIEPEFE